jgi:hypothetical protein
VITGSVSDDEAKKIHPKGWQAPRPYLRIVPQPEGMIYSSSSNKGLLSRIFGR